MCFNFLFCNSFISNLAIYYFTFDIFCHHLHLCKYCINFLINLLLGLLQTVNPMRDLLYRMLNSQHLEGVRKRRSYFSDIHDDLLKVSEMITSTREVTTDMRDSYLSLNSHQTNNVMKVLTIITSIFSPLTLIAGIYGMNFEHMPELTWKYGYFLAIGLMFGIGLAMYRWFKKNGWF